MRRALLASTIGALLLGCDGSSPASKPAQEGTEDKVRRVYDSQGIKHDDRMIRDDTRAIEQLNREFGK